MPTAFADRQFRQNASFDKKEFSGARPLLGRQDTGEKKADSDQVS
ncbi:MAG: hypothetical protein QOC74_3478 [Pseudonocardiales bacterium]|jgi:hypothetical protein|nr:hypothetical protein [Pseudonocardiales bacterium]